MNANDRQTDILEQLAKRGELSIAELSQRFEVSEMTVRRDLNQLAASGLIERTHGGAVATSSGSFEPPFGLRSQANTEAKRRIAVQAASQVVDGQTVVLDGGSTGLAIAEELVGRRITVCALNLRIAETLSADAATRVMVPAGFIRSGELSISGPDAASSLSRFRFDLFLMTASGIDITGGVTEWNVEDAAVKRAALAASRRSLVACDSSKFGRVAFARVCGLEEAGSLVTDSGIEPALGRELDAAGLELLIA